MKVVNIISMLAVPIFICVVVIHGIIRKVSVYDAFIAGARSGIGTAFRVMPYIVGMIFAVDIFKASGCFDYISNALRPALQGIGVPPEILPLALMRPFSGGDVYKRQEKQGRRQERIY